MRKGRLFPSTTSLVTDTLEYSSEWVYKKWHGLSSFWGQYVWSDGTNVYYSQGSSGQYVLNGTIWEPKTWTGLTSISAGLLWTDGSNIYYSYNDKQYVLNGDTWETKTWEGYTTINGAYIWSDGTSIYYSYEDEQYVLNGITWESKSWKGLASFDAQYIWSDGTDVYYSHTNSFYDTHQQYVLNGDTWVRKTWYGFTGLHGPHIWSDGTNVYHSEGSNGQYILNGSTWEAITWEGDTPYGDYMWTDGTNVYNSYNNEQYVLERTNTSGFCGNIVTWAFTNADRLIISGTGAMQDYDGSSTIAPWMNFKNDILQIAIEEGVTHIGSRSFSSCSNAMRLTIPSTITTVGEYAFSGMSALSGIAISSIEHWLSDCYIGEDGESCHPGRDSNGYRLYTDGQWVTKLVIPDSITSIPKYAFANCTGLEYVSLPETLTYLGHYAFLNCSKLRSLTIPNGVVGDCIYGLCDGCSAMTQLVIGDGICDVYGFGGCTSLKKIHFGKSISYARVFTPLNMEWYNKPAIEQVTISEDNEHFVAIDNIIYSKDLTTVYGIPMTMLEVSLLDSVTTFGDALFYKFDTLQSYTIPNGVKKLSMQTFTRCSNLAEVHLPDGLEYIGGHAFEDCVNLTSIDLPDSLTEIRNTAFAGCTSLVRITIPNSVTVMESWGRNDRIRYYTFDNCTSLEEVTILCHTPPTQPEDLTVSFSSPFYGCTALTKIYIPHDTTEAYSTATGWSEYADLYVELPEDAPSGTHIEMLPMLSGLLFGRRIACQRQPVKKTMVRD